MLSLRKQWIIFGAVNGVLLLTLLFFPIYWKYIKDLPFNECTMVKFLHIYCPACGGTRAFSALLHLDILSALKYNPIVPIGAIIFIIYEAAMVKYLIKKAIRDYFVKDWMVYSVLIFWGIYFVVRNVLLLFGIDLIGDILIV